MSLHRVAIRAVSISALTLMLAGAAAAEALLPGMEPCAECGFFPAEGGEVPSAYQPLTGYASGDATAATAGAAPSGEERAGAEPAATIAALPR